MTKPLRPTGERSGRAPAPPRLPAGRALRRQTGIAVEDDGYYADLEVSGGATVRNIAKRVTFERLILRDVDLSGARLEHVKVGDARWERCDFANGVWRDTALDRTELVGCRLTGLDLAELSARDLVVRECSGSLASFRFAAMKHSRFQDCELSEVDFTSAELAGVIFRGCDLRGAMLYGASLRGTDFRGSNLEGVKMRPGDLAGAIVDPVQLVGLARSLAALLGIDVRDLEADG